MSVLVTKANGTGYGSLRRGAKVSLLAIIAWIGASVGPALPAVAGELSPEGILDPEFYLSHYPDLRAAFGNDAARAREHWQAYGLSEGRQPSAFFNARAYLARYPDLEAAFGNDFRRAHDHYFASGIGEKRDATPGGMAYNSYRVCDDCEPRLDAVPKNPPAWTGLSGAGIDIAAGANGDVYLVGTDFSIYQYDRGGGSWNIFAAGVNARRVATDPEGTAWWIAADGSVSFKRKHGAGPVATAAVNASDIAAGPGGVYVIGPQDESKCANNAGQGVYHWDGASWRNIAEFVCGERIAIEPGKSTPVVLSTAMNGLASWNGSEFVKEMGLHMGQPVDFAIGQNGSWFLLDGSNGSTAWGQGISSIPIIGQFVTAVGWSSGVWSDGGGAKIYLWNGKGWQNVAGGIVSLAVDGTGRPWATNSTNNIFTWP